MIVINKKHLTKLKIITIPAITLPNTIQYNIKSPNVRAIFSSHISDALKFNKKFYIHKFQYTKSSFGFIYKKVTLLSKPRLQLKFIQPKMLSFKTIKYFLRLKKKRTLFEFIRSCPNRPVSKKKLIRYLRNAKLKKKIIKTI